MSDVTVGVVATAVGTWSMPDDDEPDEGVTTEED